MVELHGYKACSCGCGQLELNHVLWMTGGLAWECFRDGVIARLKEVQIAHGSGVVTAKIPQLPKRKQGKRTERGSRDTQRLAHAAREAARKRLAQLEPDIYEVLYNDERVKRGLTVVPRRCPEGAFAAAVASKVAEVVYSAAADQES